MKKILALVLAVVMIMAMTVPAFAATEDEVAPCATSCSKHTPGTNLGEDHDYNSTGSGTGKKCHYTVTTYYRCSVCDDIFSKVTVSKYYNHVATPVHATCNGEYQTIKYNCYNCGGYYYTDYNHPCPGAGHISGNCNWLPI